MTNPLLLAIYLPQFHPTPENDAWHGTGFTEWTVVAKNRPRFPGHDQPQLPADLGFYDLRLPEVREQQARLARAHGLSGFSYYHYWFKGQQMLERPFNEVLHSGRPDFPFSLCWANESWYRRWETSVDEMLIEQQYDEADDLEHIRWLINAFQDDRYIRVHGRPLFSVYRPLSLPDPKRTSDLWREECVRAGLPEPWLVGFESYGDMFVPADIGFDASADFAPHSFSRLTPQSTPPPGCDPQNRVWEYADVVQAFASEPQADWVRYPSVTTGWDNTPRRSDGRAAIIRGSTPELYATWLNRAVQSQSDRPDGIVYINAWNEWAEGAHLEPDAAHGRAYLEATREIALAQAGTTGLADPPWADVGPPTSTEDLYADLYEKYTLLQKRSSGYQSYLDRRLRILSEEHAREMTDQREQSRILATWALTLEQRVQERATDDAAAARAPETSRRHTICHGILHVPKCAGASLRATLAAIPGCYTGPKYFDEAHFGSERLVEGVGPANSPQIVKPEELSQIVATHRLVIGHYSLNSLLQAGCAKVSFQLREPRARLLSVYRFWQDNTDAQKADWGLWGSELMAKSDLPLFEFLVDPALLPALDNQIARQVLSNSGTAATPAHGADVAELTRALSDRLAVVAWTRQSDAFFAKVAASIGETNPPPLMRINVTDDIRDAQIIDQATLQRLDVLTATDRLLLDALSDVSSLPARTPSDLDAEFEETASRLGFTIR